MKKEKTQQKGRERGENWKEQLKEDTEGGGSIGEEGPPLPVVNQGGN